MLSNKDMENIRLNGIDPEWLDIAQLEFLHRQAAAPQQKEHISGATNPRLINALQGGMFKPQGAYLGSGAKQG